MWSHISYLSICLPVRIVLNRLSSLPSPLFLWLESSEQRYADEGRAEVETRRSVLHVRDPRDRLAETVTLRDRLSASRLILSWKRKEEYRAGGEGL